jgi:oligopeptide/dipeptide ABC transporter ATP-binding protein
MTSVASTPLLEIQDLKTWFPIQRGVLGRTVGHVRAVDGVSLSVSTGETVGLVGESGCGKSTLARTVLQLDPLREGVVRFDGQDTRQMDAAARRRFRRNVQVVFQDPFSSLNPRMTVMDIVTEGLVEHERIPRRACRPHAAQLLTDVGLDPASMDRYPHEFSGGQRQRICVARALSLKPRLVICDEAVSALDVSVQAQVINLLTDLRERHRLAYLFISHDLNIVRHISSRIVVMYLGKIVEEGRTEEVMNQPVHPYTRSLLSASPRVGEERRDRIVLHGDVPSASHPPPGCRFHPRCPWAKAECARTEPRLEPCHQVAHHRAACIRKDEI